MRKLTCILLIAVLLFGASAYSEEKTISFSDNYNLPKIIPQDHPAAAGENPLTGLPASGEAYTPILLPLDNSPEAYPLWGIGEADLLFQVPLNEIGATRLLALYGDSYPEQAGGVRSGRMTMLPLAAAFHAAFAYAGVPPIGASPVSVDNWLSEWSFRKPTRHFNLLGEHYRERVSYVQKPHNLSAHVKEIHENLSARKVSFEERAFLFADEPLNRGEEARTISIQYQNHREPSKTDSESDCSFTWDAETGAYTRTSEAGALTDRTTGETVLFANVIVMKIPLGWERGYPYYIGQMRGNGPACIFQSGRCIQGAWMHNDYTGRLVFLDETGSELQLQRGKTYLAVGDEMIVTCGDE